MVRKFSDHRVGFRVSRLFEYLDAQGLNIIKHTESWGGVI